MTGGQPLRTETKQLLTAALAAVVALWALADAWRMRWVCDDIFITFRYVDNFLAGLGPVFNAGERVEGYTHFLWFVLLTAGRAAGATMPEWSQLLGIVSFAGLLALVGIASWKLRGGASFVLPLALVMLVLHRDMRGWATGGLETMFYTFLVTAGAVCLVTGGRGRVPVIGGGALLTLAAMTRPDGVLFLFLGGCLVTLREWGEERTVKSAIKAGLLYSIPTLLVFLPWFLWRWSYYGWLFPNTYYAKASQGRLWGQGFYYLSLYFRVYWASALFLPLAVAVIIRRRGLLAGEEGSAARAALLFAGAALFYLIVFTAKVGGDFMFARFVIPVVPLMLLSIECAVRSLAPAPRVQVLCMAAILALSPVEHLARRALYPVHTLKSPRIKDNIIHGGVADEQWFYSAPLAYGGTMSVIQMGELIGRHLRPVFEDLDAGLLLPAQNVIAYHGAFHHVVEGHGLVDEEIAHAPLTEAERAGRRIGHLRRPTWDLLVAKGTDLGFFAPFLEVRDFQDARISMPDGMRIPTIIITYDRELMRELRARLGADFIHTDFEAFLDEYISGIDARPAAELRADYEYFRNYYFLHSDDSEREAAFLSWLQ